MIRIEKMIKYGACAKRWLDDVGKHYLQNAPPGCLFSVGVFDGETMSGLCLVGRPVSPKLPQDGSVGEITRMVLLPGLPHGTASRVLKKAAEIARGRGMKFLIAYHDRTRHTGCIYKKAGFRKDRKSLHVGHGWGSRANRKSAAYEQTPKQRWRLDLGQAV